MSKERKIICCLCAVIVVMAVSFASAFYLHIFYDNTMSKQEIYNYARLHSERNSVDFLEYVDNELALKETVFLVSTYKDDEKREKSQEVFVFEKKDCLFPFVKRYVNIYKYDNLTYFPYGTYSYLPKGQSRVDGEELYDVYFSANEEKIAKMVCIFEDSRQHVSVFDPEKPFITFVQTGEKGGKITNVNRIYLYDKNGEKKFDMKVVHSN